MNLYKTCLHIRVNTQVCGRLLLMTQIRHRIQPLLTQFLTNQSARPHFNLFIRITVSSSSMAPSSSLNASAIRLIYHSKFLSLNLTTNTDLIRGNYFDFKIFSFVDVRDVNTTIVMKSENTFMDIHGNYNLLSNYRMHA